MPSGTIWLYVGVVAFAALLTYAGTLAADLAAAAPAPPRRRHTYLTGKPHAGATPSPAAEVERLIPKADIKA